MAKTPTKFHTPYSRPETTGEKNSGEHLTDTTGYIRPDLRIKAMIKAGERLIDFRIEQSDIPDGFYREEHTMPYRPTELDLREKDHLIEKGKAAAKRMKERMEERRKSLSPEKPLDSGQKMADNLTTGEPQIPF